MRVLQSDVEVYSWGHAALPTVLLVHGWGVDCTAMSSFVKPLQDAGFQVITFDAPAHGASLGRSSTLRAFADRIGDVLESNTGVMGVVAHSLGGVATVAALRMHSARHLGSSHGASPALVLVSSPCDLQGTVELFRGRWRLLPDTERQMLDRLARKNRATLDFWNIRTLAPHIEPTNVLVLHDRDDDDVRPTEATEVAASFRSAKLVLTSGLGHGRILASRSVTSMAAEFLAATRRISTESTAITPSTSKIGGDS